VGPASFGICPGCRPSSRGLKQWGSKARPCCVLARLRRSGASGRAVPWVCEASEEGEGVQTRAGTMKWRQFPPTATLCGAAARVRARGSEAAFRTPLEPDAGEVWIALSGGSLRSGSAAGPARLCCVSLKQAGSTIGRCQEPGLGGRVAGDSLEFRWEQSPAISAPMDFSSTASGYHRVPSEPSTQKKSGSP
jgi:hypothetical protein